MKNNAIAKRILKNFDTKILKRLKECNGYIAGGAVLSAFTKSKINDFDIYFHNEDDMNRFKSLLEAKNEKIAWMSVSKRKGIRRKAGTNIIIIDSTNNAITYLHKDQIYQVISAFTGTPNEVFRFFDFSVCMGSYNPESNSFELNDQFMTDVMSKNMHFNIGTEYPIASLLRLLKYQRKGYNVSGVEIIKMGLAINALKINTYGDLKRQLQGIDTSFLAELTRPFETEEYKDKEFQFNEFLTMLDEFIDVLERNLNPDSDEE